MAYGNNKVNNYSAGTYAGSQVATGGQVGRPKTVHNGVGGAKQGGANVGGSQRGFFRTGSGAYRFANGRGGLANVSGRPPAGSHLIANPLLSKFAKTHRSQTRVSLPKFPVATAGQGFDERAPYVPVVGGGASPLTPVAGDPVGSAGDSFNGARDSEYWNSLRQEQRGYDDSVGPLLAKLQALRSFRPQTGKTLYDELYGRAQSQFGQDVSQSRHEASRSGLLRSGAYDRTASGLADRYYQGNADLESQYGLGAQNDLQSQIGQRDTQLIEAKRMLALAAAARLRDQQAAANADANSPTYYTGA